MTAGPRLRGDVAGVECAYSVAPGRSSVGCLRGNAIVLPIRGVSRRHAELSLDGAVLRIRDLGSRNGVRVNGALVQAARLQPGDEVEIGPVRLRVEWEGHERPAAPVTSEPEARALRLAMAAAACLVAQLVLGKATRDAFFLARFDVGLLPVVMACSSALAILVVLYISRAQAGSPPGRVASQLCGAGAACLLGLWGLALGWPRAAALILYGYTAAFGAALLSSFWAVANERFDPRAAKRLLGRIAGAASLGGLVGGLVAWISANRLPITAMIPAMAALTAAGGLAIRSLGRGEAPADPRTASSGGLLAGVRVLRDEGYLRLLAGAVALSTSVEALLDYALKAQAAASLSRAELLGFFSVFHAGTGLAALAGQALVTGRVLERAGLATTMALAPAGVAGAAAAALGAPSLATSVAARGGQVFLHSSFFRPGYELCFTALPATQRRPAKTVVDVGADKLGAVAGAGLILVLSALDRSSLHRSLFALALLGSVVVLALSRRLHRGYVNALSQSLRSGALDAADVEGRDATTQLTLAGFLQPPTLRLQPEATSDPLVVATSALRSSDPAVVRSALQAFNPDPRLAPHMVPLLARSDLSADALRALRRLTPRITGLLVDCLMDPGLSVEARARIPTILRACATGQARDGLLLGLSSPELTVRRRCARALLRLQASSPSLSVASATAMALAGGELAAAGAGPDAPDSAASSNDPRLAHVFDLLALALDPSAVRGAYQALTTPGGRRGTALEYLENVLPVAIRDSLWRRLGEPVATSRPAP